MTHPSPSPHADHATGPRPYFTDAEWQAFRRDDVKAGGAIVGLMIGIFTIGLLLYASICVVVW